MEYVGYVICIIIAYFTFRIGWRIFGKTLSRWQRHRMSEWTFFQKRLAYSIALAFIFGGIPAYIIFSYSHPNHKDSFNDKKEPILYNSLIISTYEIEKRKRVTIWLLLKFPGLP